MRGEAPSNFFFGITQCNSLFGHFFVNIIKTYIQFCVPRQKHKTINRTSILRTVELLRRIATKTIDPHNSISSVIVIIPMTTRFQIFFKKKGFTSFFFNFFLQHL